MMKKLETLFFLTLLAVGTHLGAMTSRQGVEAARAGAKNEMQLTGTITAFGDGLNFVLDSMTSVDCDEYTVYENVSGFDGLRQGDRVEVTGNMSWNVLYATNIRVLDGPGSGLSFDGTVEEILDETSFSTTDGDTVTTNDETVLENMTGVPDLMPGDRVHVEGDWQWGAVLAALVRKSGNGGGGSLVSEGLILGFESAGAFRLEDGTLVLLDDSTFWNGLSGPGDLLAGDRVRVEWSGSRMDPASSVTLLEWAFEDAFSAVVGQVLSGTRLLLSDSTEVRIDLRTDLVGIDSIDELLPGQTVNLVGAWWNDVFLAWSIEVDFSGMTSIEGIVRNISMSTLSFDFEDGTLVQTDDLTVFVGISGLSQLVSGDSVRVEGGFQGDAFLAARVELLTDPGGIEQWVSGEVAAVPDASSFALDSGLRVDTNTETQMLGFDAISELQAGDLVEAMGSLEGSRLLASWVYLVDTAPAIETISGQLAYLASVDRFVLDDGTRIRISPETEWDGLNGIEDLQVGDELGIEGFWNPDVDWGSNWDFQAVRVVLNSSGGGQSISREGWVAGIVPPDRVDLLDGTRLNVPAGARFVNFGHLSDLLVGDKLWIEATTTDDPTMLDVRSLEILQRPGTLVEFVSQVSSVSTWNQSFSTSNGFEVRVDVSTSFSGISNLGELSIGDTVAVSGRIGMDPQNPHQVLAETVSVEDGGGGAGGGGGLLTTIQGVVTGLCSPQCFVVDETWTIEVTEETLWRKDLEGYADLSLAMPVRCQISLDGGSLVRAVWVEKIGGFGAGLEAFSGEIREIDAAESSVTLIDGTRLLFDEYSTFDGDADTFAEISVGMLIEAYAVDLLDGSALVFSAVLTLQPNFVGSLGFDDGPFSESLVVLRGGASVSAVAARHGAVVRGSLPGLLVFLFQWEDPIGMDGLQELLDDEDVEIVEPNRNFTDPESDPEGIRRRAIAIDRSPTSDKFNDQSAVVQAKLAEAHQRNHGEGTLVAVLDTGIDLLHPLMRGRIAPGGWDFVDGDAEPWETADGIDEDGDAEIDEAAGHGSFVAGLILLAAPSTSILPYRVLNDDGRGTTFAICEAVLLAIDRGVDVINMSFAYPDRSRVMDRILMEASQRGIVLVAGAGNSASTELPFPAVDNRVLAVAALDGLGEVADFSNRGEDISLGAPGVDLYSAGMDAGFGRWGGTSMAAPLVSGTVALLRSANPSLSPEQVADALRQGSLSGDIDVGHILDAAASLGLVPDAQ